jgi:septum formation topological specificity factor MinE
MGLLDLFKKKGSSDVAKDRLKLLLVSELTVHQRLWK